jgi:hypothetical protein
MAKEELEKLLTGKFAANHVKAAIGHYQKAIDEFHLGEWENSIAKCGKFAEAALKALWAHVGETVATGKDFKAGAVIDGLANKPGANHSDTIRLTTPRACRIVYDVASNRGGRHDPGEIDPNQMDATLVVSTSSWILAEMLRYSQKGAIDLQAATELVASLNERKFPFSEDIDGRLYFSLKGLSARDVVLLTLWKIHPRRMSKKDLIAAAKRHGNSEPNAAVGISRLYKVVDDDGNGNLRLLMSGVQEAEALIASKNKSKS